MSARGVYRATMLAVIAGCVLVSYLVLTHRDEPSPKLQAGPRPDFQLPFPCGETWLLTTYPGHDDYDIDFFAATGPTAGRTVIASAAGTVTWAGYSATLSDGTQAAPGTSGTRGGLGYGVILDHGGGWFTEYGHLASSPAVHTGDRVPRGAVLGQVGHTGSTTVDHLHYEQLDDTRDPRRTRGVDDKVEAVFDGVPSGITSDGSAGTGPLRVDGPQSPDQTRTSRNCPAE
ncbi:M23 family metallopeptidase [Dactylosporangium salmoneum]|uniref:M23ase beta-sheet core domain-containing protein n=1 Tax=Dactylosporangium salmoneum TaxID=53361 RepID=A0ABP5SR99_9ACTN